jgi:hypothetical protein
VILADQHKLRFGDGFLKQWGSRYSEFSIIQAEVEAGLPQFLFKTCRR